jgi:hypothetical protein
LCSFLRSKEHIASWSGCNSNFFVSVVGQYKSNTTINILDYYCPRLSGQGWNLWEAGANQISFGWATLKSEN